MKRFLVAFTFAVAALAATVAPGASVAQAPAKELGIAIGVKAPPIAATTQTGASATFAELRGQNGMVLAFVRSADWCPFCKQQLKDLNKVAPELKAKGYPLAALSYDSVETLARFASANGLQYTLLSDPKSSVIDAFGVRNLDVAGSKRMDGIPNPAIFVISADGVVLSKLYEADYKKRPSGEAVLKAIQDVGQKAMPRH
jgi:peroxiredoxin